MENTVTMNHLFEESISTINNFYKTRGYKLGWRFLNGSKKTLNSNPSIALITANPGGYNIPNDHPWESCEDGSSYLYERWGNSAQGQGKLQVQIQLLFDKIIEHAGWSIQRNEIIEQSLTGYFVPFRSPSLADLEYKSEACQFAQKLWGNILAHVKPTLFICIDKDTHCMLSPIISSIYGLKLTSTKKIRTGWGEYSADLDTFGDQAQVTMIRLPHLSRFTLFTSSKCSDQLNVIFHEACVSLRKQVQHNVER